MSKIIRTKDILLSFEHPPSPLLRTKTILAGCTVVTLFAFILITINYNIIYSKMISITDKSISNLFECKVNTNTSEPNISDIYDLLDKLTIFIKNNNTCHPGILQIFHKCLTYRVNRIFGGEESELTINTVRPIYEEVIKEIETIKAVMKDQESVNTLRLDKEEFTFLYTPDNIIESHNNMKLLRIVKVIIDYMSKFCLKEVIDFEIKNIFLLIDAHKSIGISNPCSEGCSRKILIKENNIQNSLNFNGFGEFSRESLSILEHDIISLSLDYRTTELSIYSHSKLDSVRELIFCVINERSLSQINNSSLTREF